jgi:hypothetical protein
MKNHDNSEYWTYKRNDNRHIWVMYNIDNNLYTFAMACQYLMDTYKMEIGQAAQYVSEITRHF